MKRNATPGQRPGLHSAEQAESAPPDAARRIDEACREAIAGKLALRAIAAWTRPFALDESEFRLLWLLHAPNFPNLQGVDQTAIANRLAVSPAQVSSLVERLRGATLVESESAVGDRRRQLWRLTAAGAALVSEIVAHVERGNGTRELAIPPLAPPIKGEVFEEAA